MTKFFLKFKEKAFGNPYLCALSLVFLLVAALSRFLYLGNKPIHFDESINMWFVKRIWEEGYFTYDPTNYHGPLLFYLIQFVQLFTGFDFLSTRWVATVFSFLTLAALWFGPVAERRAFRWSAVFLLFSPAMGFYGRSGIHESAFVFFQVLGFLSFHFLVAKEFKNFWWTFAASLLGMMALKETFVILILAVIPALIMVWFTDIRKTNLKKWFNDLSASLQQREVYFPLLVMLLLFIGVYSGFGAHPRGLIDFVVALMPWLKTGVHGNGHEKEFFHWLKFMANNEYATFLVFFAGLPFVIKNKWLRFYFVFTFFLWLIYSLIPYKTPWCLISILWPFALVAGFGLAEWTRKISGWKEALFYAALLILFGGEFSLMYELMYRNPINMDHPYVYVNSTYQMKEFIEKTQALLKEDPLLREQIVQIGTEESWPMPIVFHNFYTLSYFKANARVEPEALIYMVDEKDQASMEAQLKERNHSALYQVFSLRIRQSRSSVLVYLKKKYFENKFSWQLKEVGEL
ncbi:MAG TPA: glycosyltransferase family 39 protein [Pseudobdellovibrionaceae bacterium]